MLAARRELRYHCRFYFAGSSEMFGKVEATPQSRDDTLSSPQPLRHQQMAGETHTLREFFERGFGEVGPEPG